MVGTTMTISWKKCLLIVCFIGLIVCLHSYASNLITLDALKHYKDTLLLFVSRHYLYSLALFSLIYIVSTALVLPIAALLTLGGGYLFGVAAGTLIVTISATVGAVCTFLVVRYLLGNYIQGRYRTQLSWLNNELAHYGSYYLLALRLMPIVPFFLTNILGGLSSISLITFLWTTALGIIPGTFVYALAGQELGTIQTIHDIFSLRMLLALSLLSLCALAPIMVRKIQR